MKVRILSQVNGGASGSAPGLGAIGKKVNKESSPLDKIQKGWAGIPLINPLEPPAMKSLPSALFLSAGLSSLTLAQPPAPIAPAQFDRLHALIHPQPGESPWREITWLTNVTEARQRSIAEDRPIVIFTAADGSPIGRT